MPKRSSSASEYALRSTPILCVAGIAIAAVGHLAGMPLTRKVGTGIFLCGFAVWCFANGISLLSGLVRTVRRDRFRAFSDEPWSTAFFVFNILVLFFSGSFLVWWALSGREFSD
jgi:uncharacterized membrane protein